MRTPEQLFWDDLRPRLQALKLDPQRVENVIGAGTPDINYIQGWIETKVVPEWPHRPVTPVRVPHFESHQSSWHARRWAAGGLCWLMVKVAETREVFLFSGWESQFVRSGLSRGMWYQMAAWSNGGIWTEDLLDPLFQLLVGDSESMTDALRARFDRLLCGKSLAEVAEELSLSTSEVVSAECGNNDQVLNDLIEYWEA